MPARMLRLFVPSKSVAELRGRYSEHAPIKDVVQSCLGYDEYPGLFVHVAPVSNVSREYGNIWGPGKVPTGG